MKATLSQYRQSPRKMRLVADMIKNDHVDTAIRQLTFSTKKAAQPIKKLIESAISNAENNDGKKRENLKIDTLTVDQGPTLKRFRPRAHGRATEIKKRTSHVHVKLSEK